MATDTLSEADKILENIPGGFRAAWEEHHDNPSRLRAEFDDMLSQYPPQMEASIGHYVRKIYRLLASSQN